MDKIIKNKIKNHYKQKNIYIVVEKNKNKKQYLTGVP